MVRQVRGFGRFDSCAFDGTSMLVLRFRGSDALSCHLQPEAFSLQPAAVSVRPRAMPDQPCREVFPHVRPLGGEDGVHDGVAHAAVATRRVVAQHAVLLRPEALDRALGAEVEIVGAQADHLAPERVEGVSEEEQLARRVDVGALAAGGVPGVADLDPIDGRGRCRGSGSIPTRSPVARSRTTHGSMCPSRCPWSASATYFAMPSGAGTDVNHSSHKRPSDAAMTRPS